MIMGLSLWYVKYIITTFKNRAKLWLAFLSFVPFLMQPRLVASTAYSTNVTSATSLTISAATSGMPGKDYGVYLFDSSGVKRPSSEYSYIVNSSTHSVDITFNPAFTGTVKLKGLFPSDTNHSYDFQLSTNPYVDGGITVCDGCVDDGSGYARRTYNGIHYVSVSKASATIDLSCNGAWTYAYILDNQLYFGIGNGACISNIVNAKLATGLWTYPTGSIPLGKIRVYYSNFDTPVDDRPF